MALKAVVSMVLLLALAVASAGCVASAADSYKDADERFAKSLNGGHTSTEQIVVPTGTSTLRVAVHYDMQGAFTMSLKDPSGREAKSINEGGMSKSREDNWVVRQNPGAGTWTLMINAGGSGAYSVGVYID
jgi:hypothetical protein